jgi:hypothetical protein
MLITDIGADGKVLLPAKMEYHLDPNEGEELPVNNSLDRTVIPEKAEMQKRFEKWLSVMEKEKK